MTSAQEILEALIGWFDRVGAAWLDLPTGPFGRPYDNLHQLTWAATRPRKLLIELDQQLLLVITGPSSFKVEESEFSIEPFAQVTFDWQEYGNLRSHAETFSRGRVRFVAQRTP